MSRTGNNIYKRKDGRWEARYIKGHDENGRAKYGYIYAKTYREVKDKQVSALSRKSTDNASGSQAFYREWLDRWLLYIKPQVKESTFIRYQNLVNNHIKPQAGDLHVSEINNGFLKNYMSDLLSSGRLDNNGGLSPKTVSDIIILIKETMRYIGCYVEELNCDFRGLKIKSTSKNFDVLSINEERILVASLFNDMSLTKLGILISLYTGIRIGELCALKWKDILFEEKVIVIGKTMQRLQKDSSQLSDINNKTYILISEPKSRCSMRKIPLPDIVLRALQDFKSSDENYILTNDSYRFIEPRTLQNRFKRLLKDLNMRNIKYHSLRHTFATRCVEAGVDTKSLSEILGHSSVRITLDKYVHSTLEQKRANMEKLQNNIINYSPSNF